MRRSRRLPWVRGVARVARGDEEKEPSIDFPPTHPKNVSQVCQSCHTVSHTDTHSHSSPEGVREKSFIPCSTARTPRDSSRSPSSAMALECRPAEGHVGPPGRGRRRSSPGAARSSAGARRGGEVRKGDKKPNGRNLPNIQPSGNRGTPRVPGSLPGHDTTCQMPQPGSSRRVTLYSAAITAPARPPAPPGQWRRSCGWA